MSVYSKLPFKKKKVKTLYAKDRQSKTVQGLGDNGAKEYLYVKFAVGFTEKQWFITKLVK